LDYLTTHTSLSPIRRGFAPGFVNDKNRCTRLTAASDKVYQLFAHSRWFSPASSTTKTGRHDIAEILLKVALNTINQSINQQHFSYILAISLIGSRNSSTQIKPPTFHKSLTNFIVKSCREYPGEINRPIEIHPVHLDMSGIQTHNYSGKRVRVMEFNASFNNISVIQCRSVLLVEETGVPGEYHLTCRKSLTSFIT
jgi:hypothetical protein